ncbi:MAG TPA: LPXTG cell wall anchor domain-containing protein [Acidimicrobiales bacterium]|nr:LPXTG cell wall anchor domain-containing protein [Acidimicrobiales bacterium]
MAAGAVAPAAVAHSSGGEIVQVGHDESIVLSVNAETPAAMVGVDIVVPPGFTLDQQQAVDVKGGGVGGVFITWQGQFAAGGIHAGGPGIADGGVVLVTFSGTAQRVGTLSFVTVTHAADGTVVRWDGSATSPHPAALVYVVSSLTPGSAVVPGLAAPSTGSGPPWWALAIAGVGALALVAGVLTRRRSSSGKIPRKVSIPDAGDRR